MLGVKDEEFAFRVCKATRDLWSARDAADQLYDALSDWLPETASRGVSSATGAT